MRALVGALVGLVVAAAVVAGIGIAVRGSYWSVIPAGLAAGVIMRAMAKGAGSSYLAGGLATLATVLAAASGPLITTEWFRNQTNRLQPATAQAEPADGVAGENEAAPDAGELAEREPPPTRRVSLSESMTLGPPPDGAAGGSTFSTAEITCLVVGCLAAYLLGGSGATSAKVSEAEAGADSEASGEEPAGDGPEQPIQSA